MSETMFELTAIPVSIGDTTDFANASVFSTGSRGFRAVFKAVINVGTDEEPDYRRFQVQTLATEVGSKGQENYAEYKAKKDLAKAEKKAPVVTAPLTSSENCAPRIATEQS